MSIRSKMMAIAIIAIAAVLVSCKPVVESDPEPTYQVLVAGISASPTNIDVPCLWTDGTRASLSVKNPAAAAMATGIKLAGGAVYISGATRDAGGLMTACYWADGVRTDMASIDPDGTEGTAIEVVNSQVYLGFSDYGDAGGAGYYIGGTRYLLCTGYGSYIASTQDLCVSGDYVYVCGTNNGGSYNLAPAYWTHDGINCATGSLEGGSWAWDHAAEIIASGSDVYVCGTCASVPCRWLNGARTDLPVSVTYGDATGMFIANGVVYISGSTKNVSNIDVPCYWRGDSRIDLPVIDQAQGGRTSAIFVIDGDVYISGSVFTAEVIETPCYWVNGSRIDLPRIANDRAGRATSIFVRELQ